MAKRATTKRKTGRSTRRAAGSTRRRAKTWSTRPKAMSLHIGLNSVGAAHYGGWSGELTACEFDANDMAALAKASGMKTTLLLTKRGTRPNTLAAIRDAAKKLKAGDLFFL